MKYDAYEKNDRLHFYPVVARTRAKNDGKVRLTDEAFEVLDNIYLQTGIPLSQLASEMIKFASSRICVEVRPTGEEDDE